MTTEPLLVSSNQDDETLYQDRIPPLDGDYQDNQYQFARSLNPEDYNRRKSRPHGLIPLYVAGADCIPLLS